MVNFNFKTTPIYISINGEKHNIKDLPDNSVKDMTTAKELINNHVIHTEKSDILRILHPHTILELIRLEQAKGVKDCLYEKDPLWGVTYNQSLHFYVENMFKRYRSSIHAADVSSNYPNQKAFKKIANDRAIDKPSLTVAGREYETLSDIKQIAQKLNKDSDYRGNTAGFTCMIPYVNDELFNHKMEYTARQAIFGGSSYNTLAYLILEYLKHTN